jgi:putative ABC transport system permease protein
MAKALKNDYAEIENTVRFDMHEEIIEHNGQQILESGILVTDPSIFDIFSYKLTKGDVHSALNEPYTIVLTQSTAKKYLVTKISYGHTLLIYMNDSTW